MAAPEKYILGAGLASTCSSLSKPIQAKLGIGCSLWVKGLEPQLLLPMPKAPCAIVGCLRTSWQALCRTDMPVIKHRMYTHSIGPKSRKTMMYPTNISCDQTSAPIEYILCRLDFQVLIFELAY